MKIPTHKPKIKRIDMFFDDSKNPAPAVMKSETSALNIRRTDKLKDLWEYRLKLLPPDKNGLSDSISEWFSNETY